MSKKSDEQYKNIRVDQLTDEQILQVHEATVRLGTAMAVEVEKGSRVINGVAVGLLSISTLLNAAEHLKVPPDHFLHYLQGLIDLHNRRAKLVAAREAKNKQPTMPDETRYLLVHPEMGVYLGNREGLELLWSKCNPKGMPVAPTFATEEEARRFIQSWAETPEKYEQFAYVPITNTTGLYVASIAECVAVGIEAWNPTPPVDVSMFNKKLTPLN